MPGTRLEKLEAELARRNEALNQPTRLERLEAEQQRRDQPQLLTTPVEKTGDFSLDNRGRAIPTGAFRDLGVESERILPDEFEFDSEEAIRLQRAEEGVDFRRGLPFFKRLQIATTSPIPRARAQRVAQVMSEEISKVPEGIAPVRWDPALQEFQFAAQITPEDVAKGFEKEESIGKFRYVSLDGSGLELADIADLINLGEIGSIAGAIAGAGRGRFVTFGKGGEFTQQAAGSFAGGTAGRITGDSLSVLLDVITTDGEFVPTYDELVEMGLQDAQIELLASLVGESLALGLRKGTNVAQDAFARMTGREGVFGSAESVAGSNVNIMQAREDLARIQDVTGRTDVTLSRGQSAGSISMIELENSRIKNASPATRRTIEIAQANNNRATQEFVDNVFGGDLQVWNNRHGVIKSANRALEDANVLVTTVDDGLVGFHPMVSPESGVKVRPTTFDGGEYVWQVKGAQLPEQIRGIGIGNDLYRAAAQEARAHGAVLVSDDNVTEAAMKVWRASDGSDAFGKLEFNSNITFNEALQRWESDVVGEPVVRMAKARPVTPLLMREFRQPAQGANGRFVADKEFARFIRNPSRGELGAVKEEIANNRFFRQDIAEGILADWDRNVKKGGKFSVKEFEKWKGEVGILDDIFTPEEMVTIRSKRSGLRQVVHKNREGLESLEKSLSQTLKLGDDAGLLRNPAGASTIYQQLKNMDIGKARRTVALLQQADMLNGVRELFKEDMKNILLPKVSARGASKPGAANFSKFIQENETLIRTMFPESPNLAQQYVSDLRLLGRMQDRKAVRSVVPGTREEANPSALAVTRVAFGPLSRAQRFLTAARRVQTRRMGESAIEMISDPQKLRTFMRIREMPLANSQVMQTLSRLGFADVWDDRDIEDPRVRQEIANEINEMRIVMDEAREGN
jgi:hypothetical protein